MTATIIELPRRVVCMLCHATIRADRYLHHQAVGCSARRHPSHRDGA